MAAQRDVVVLVGSLRKGSYTRKIALAIAGLAPPTLRLEIVELRDLPLYDQDLDGQPPAPWVAFRKRIAAADAVLFVTPEYNRSIPGGLEDAIDRASRPHGENSFRPFRGGALQYPLSQYVSGPDPISVLSSIW